MDESDSSQDVFYAASDKAGMNLEVNSGENQYWGYSFDLDLQSTPAEQENGLHDLGQTLRDHYNLVGSNSSSRGKYRTPRELTRIMQQHRDSERLRHRDLNAALFDITNSIPGHNGTKKETKIVKLQRVINYICHLEGHIQDLCEELDIGLEFKNLFLSPHMSEEDSKKPAPGNKILGYEGNFRIQEDHKSSSTVHSDPNTGQRRSTRFNYRTLQSDHIVSERGKDHNYTYNDGRTNGNLDTKSIPGSTYVIGTNWTSTAAKNNVHESTNSENYSVAGGSPDENSFLNSKPFVISNLNENTFNDKKKISPIKQRPTIKQPPFRISRDNPRRKKYTPKKALKQKRLKNRENRLGSEMEGIKKVTKQVPTSTITQGNKLGTGNPFDWFENASKSLKSNTVIKKPHQAKVKVPLMTGTIFPSTKHRKDKPALADCYLKESKASTFSMKSFLAPDEVFISSSSQHKVPFTSYEEKINTVDPVKSTQIKASVIRGQESFFNLDDESDSTNCYNNDPFLSDTIKLPNRFIQTLPVHHATQVCLERKACYENRNDNYKRYISKENNSADIENIPSGNQKPQSCSSPLITHRNGTFLMNLDKNSVFTNVEKLPSIISHRLNVATPTMYVNKHNSSTISKSEYELIERRGDPLSPLSTNIIPEAESVTPPFLTNVSAEGLKLSPSERCYSNTLGSILKLDDDPMINVFDLGDQCNNKPQQYPFSPDKAWFGSVSEAIAGLPQSQESGFYSHCGSQNSENTTSDLTTDLGFDLSYSQLEKSRTSIF